MLCYAIDQQKSSIGQPTNMYRNPTPDPNPSPTSNQGFFQTYPPKEDHGRYPVPNYGIPQPHASTADPFYPSSLGGEYGSQFPAPPPPHLDAANWGPPVTYSGANFAPMMNSTWDMNSNFHPTHHPIISSAGPTYQLPTNLSPTSAVNGDGSPGSVPTTLTGIECFSTPPEMHGAPGLPPLHASQIPPAQRRPYEWISKNAYQNTQTQQVGKTRTKDKYRVVYSDHQRLELEKEFRFSRYITIRRKAELAGLLCLSERQIKIWFQNRRAKERKATKKTGEPSKDFDKDEAEAADDDVTDHPMTSSPIQHMQSGCQYIPPDLSRDHGILESRDGGIAHASFYEMPPHGTMNYTQLNPMDIKPIIPTEAHRSLSSTSDDVTHGQPVMTSSHGNGNDV
uniref:Transcription factor protein n=1 Tax=Ciona intestinalis TaxID=7719 RepID=Q4H3T1_CIOIN|nr:transcription factor protein [Ciona intestinalis]BAE06346.1 transcription factor protein [Ciona intestinalis]|eukprot:NP_001071669.1 transcription factor protein [Ciona intestinalis]